MPSNTGTVTWLNRKFDYTGSSSGAIQISEQGVTGSLHNYSLKYYQSNGTLANVTGCSVYN